MSDLENTTSRIDELRKRIRELEAESDRSVSILEDLSTHQEELRLQNEQLRETQGELDLSRERYRQLFDFLPIGVVILDDEGIIREANHAISEMIDRKRSRILGHPFLPLLKATDYQAVSLLLANAAAGRSGEMKATLVTASSGTIDVALQIAPFQTDDEKKRQIYVTATDIRDEVRAVTQLQESEQRFRSVAEQTPNGLCITRSDGTFEYVNAAYASIYGYAPEEMIDRPFTIVVPEDRRNDLDAIHHTFINGETQEFAGEFEVVKKDGTLITVEATSARIFGADGFPRKATFVIDVTRRRKREEKLRQLRHALDATGDSVFLVDAETMRCLDVNQGAVDLLGYTREELLTMGPQDIDAELSREEIARHYETLRKLPGSTKPIQTTHRRKDGSLLPIEMQIGLYQDNGSAVVIGIGRDITERLRIESELRRVNRDLDRVLKERTSSLTSAHEELQLMNSVMENSLDGVTITDAEGVIQQVNTQFTIVTGYSQEEAVGKTPRVLKSGHHDELFYQRLWAKIQNTGEWQGEIWNRRKNGGVYPEWLVIRAIYDGAGLITHYVAVFHDLSELRAAEEAVAFQTNFDALTRLPNRRSFLERVDGAIRAARRTESSIAVAIVDVDDFRKVNETAGHTTGDAFLRDLSISLREAVGEDATLARIGGDEFGVLIEGITDQWDYLETTNRIATICGSSITIEDRAYELTLSLGVALFPSDADSAEELLNAAEAALYQVKDTPIGAGNGRVGMYTPELNEALRRRIALESAMRVDLEAGRFVPYYQPRVDLTSGRIVGAEALARWIQADGTIVSPAEFIPLAEDTGLIVRIGEVMLQRIAEDLSGVLAPYRDNLTISFNASIKELRDPGFLARFDEISAQHFSDIVELELTESVVMDDIDTSMPILEGIKARGLSLAVDDFGTGYSSLFYLKRLPIDVLKIDKSFIDDVATDPNDQAIVATIIAMGSALNLTLVAEGVETSEQEQFLTNHGCTQGQGYLYGKPVDRDAFVEFLSRRVKAIGPR